MTKKTVGERMAVIENDIGNIKDDINEIKTSLKDHIAREDEKFDNFGKSFAGKWIEKGFWVIITALIVMAISIIMGSS